MNGERRIRRCAIVIMLVRKAKKVVVKAAHGTLTQTMHPSVLNRAEGACLDCTFSAFKANGEPGAYESTKCAGCGVSRPQF